MVLIYDYPKSIFAQPLNIFFGHIITGAVLIIVLAIVINRFILKIEYPIDKNKST